ncbi:MAG: DUF3501 family protein [Acidimicrobiales bacterium]|jgi:hypothetical protein|nr:DUF3501 family protein [Acidimicrobiales bacterium]
MAKLTIDDITDMRAYERERSEFRAHVIDLKSRRRVHVGPIVTFVFENRDTIRFQIQEMARVEKIISDQGIEAELRAYNPLIPDPGHLSATMFIELTSDAELREWLPKLVGIERAVELRVGPDAEAVGCLPDPDHDAQLTRDEITASVHYVGWSLTPDQVEAFATGPVVLAVTHPAYAFELELGDATRAELLADLRG